MDIIEKIELEKDKQSKIRNKISDFIIADPILCSFYSLKELSLDLDVSEATIISYCKSLGIDKFIELKKQLQQYIMKKYSPKERISFISKRNNSANELYSKIAQDEKIAFNSTININNSESVETFVKFIMKAENIYIVSHDFTDIAAHYLQRRLSGFNKKIIKINPFDVKEVNKHLNNDEISSKLIIAITIFPYGPTTLAISELAQNLNIPIVSITDSKDSPICEFSNTVLYCKSNIMGVTNTLVTLLLLIDIITISLINNDTTFHFSSTNSNYTDNDQYTKLIIKHSIKKTDNIKY